MSEESNIAHVKSKIEELNASAWNLRLKDSESAFKLSLESVKLANEIDYKQGLAMGMLVKGYCHMRRSENKEALHELSTSLSLFESLNDIKGQAEAFEYLSAVRRNLGEIEESLNLSFKALDLVIQIGYTEKEASNHYQLAVTYKRLGNFEKALEHLYQSLDIIGQFDNELYRSYAINLIGAIYFENNDYEKALDYFKQGLDIRHKFGDKWGEAGSLDNIGYCYLKLQKFDEANAYINQSLEINSTISDKRGQSNAFAHLAELCNEKNDTVKAKDYADKSLELRKSIGDKRAMAEVLLLLAEIETKDNVCNDTQLLNYLHEALQIAEEVNAIDISSKVRKQLYEQAKSKGDFQEALSQLELHQQLEITLNKNAVTQKIASLEITNKAEEAKREAVATRLKNEELTKLNQEISEQKTKLEATLASLKATQAQLIQSEKMASLGELTAGIAHEIQNPLNFVNNFSELSNELVDEMKEELATGNLQQATDIADDIKQNLEKINHHGKRADAIVKGMLQHSRTSSGQKEPTDVNVLCDEYLRLAYHGLRAKDKSFNASFETHFDESIGKIKIVPQDIGRVLLNLINNAFYAVNERQKVEGEGFKPLVEVTTKSLDDSIEIAVLDNGGGIPDHIKEKIFQPFFTTKPTGRGTGLGLSLSYDIIKAHGGELKLETELEQGTTFIIQLPIV